MWKDKGVLSHRFRLYPSKPAERKLNHMALCRWLYNRLLSELNFVHEKGIRLKQGDTQACSGWAKAER